MTNVLDKDNPQHRVLQRLILARSDINEAHAAASHIVGHITDTRNPLCSPLMCAAVTCYSRPFITTRTCQFQLQRLQEHIATQKERLFPASDG